jgi:transaldolase / glucose-6-phosphate isomerase
MTLRLSHSGAATAAVKEFVPALVQDQVASRLFAKDHTLWGKAAESEAAIRLGWVDAWTESLKLIPELIELRQSLSARGLTRVVLCGMGGSSLAPEVITNSFGSELLILDSTDPSQVRAALSGDLKRTVVVVSSKSGSTVETDSQKRSFEQAFEAAGIDKTERIFVVTDPNSPMHIQAKADGYRVFLSNPDVGGRYSALTAFGVVPSMLAGVEMKPLLDQASQASEILSGDSLENPGLVLGAALARSRYDNGFKDKIGIFSNGSPVVGFGDWVEQLVAESTGKNGLGVLPVVLESDSIELEAPASDLLLVELRDQALVTTYDLSISGELGELILLWEVATAVSSRLLGVNPFDQPDVESAKIAARGLLDSPSSQGVFSNRDGDVSFATFGYQGNAKTLEESLSELFDQLEPSGYVAIHCYLNRQSLKQAEKLRGLASKRTGRPTTFGWGPRFLHSTGQYHKGGPKQGVFLQIVSGSGDDEPIPGRDFGYRALINSQASGDAKVLADNGLPVLVIQLEDPAAGLQRLIGLLS